MTNYFIHLMFTLAENINKLQKHFFYFLCNKANIFFLPKVQTTRTILISAGSGKISKQI